MVSLIAGPFFPVGIVVIAADYLTVSSRKDLSIAPCFFGGFLFHMQGISD